MAARSASKVHQDMFRDQIARRKFSRTRVSAGEKSLEEARARSVKDNIDSSIDIDGPYQRELSVACQAVRLAGTLCDAVQLSLLRKEVLADTKDDRSLVTLADYGAQAAISYVLTKHLGNIKLVAEETSEALREGGEGGSDMLNRVTEIVNEALHASGSSDVLSSQDASRFHSLLALHLVCLRREVLQAIDKGISSGGGDGRHWVLDPVDGTFGFVKGDQYAIALALVERGEVVAGVLGCPNMPARASVLDQSESFTYGYTPAQVSRLLAANTSDWQKGVLLFAGKGMGSWQVPIDATKKVKPQRVQVSNVDNMEHAKFCEPVLKSNSSQGFSASVANAMGIRSKPLRVFSQAKYGSVARGDAEVFMKFPQAGYREKVWDHAAGAIVVEEAGGVVCDAGGNRLDMSSRFIEGLDRGIVACTGLVKDKLLEAVAESWESAEL